MSKSMEDRMQDVEESGAVKLLSDTMQPILDYLQKVPPDKDGRLKQETVAVLGGITHAFVDLLYEATNNPELAKTMIDYVTSTAHREHSA